MDRFYIAYFLYLQHSGRLLYTFASALYFSVSCPTLAIAFWITSVLVMAPSNFTLIICALLSQLADETPLTDFAAFSIRSLHMSHLPETRKED